MNAMLRCLLCAAAVLLLPAAASAQNAVGGSRDGQAWYDFGGGGAYLGVYLEELSEGVRKALGVEEDQGVLIARVTDDGPAASAGVESGDVLLSVGGRTVNSSSRLSRVLDRFEPEEEVVVIVYRKGEEKKLQVTLGKRPGYSVAWSSPQVVEMPQVDAPAVQAYRFPNLFDAGAEGLGLRVEDLTGQLAEFFEVPRGVLITWIRRDTPAARAGLKAGDVIIEVEGQPIQGQSDLGTVLGDLRRARSLELVVVRRGERRTVTLERK